MEELRILLQKILNKDLQQIILSNSRNPEQIQKVKIRPVLIRDELLFQETRYKGTQVFHENYTAAQMTDGICAALQEQFRQGEEYRKNGGLTTGDILKKRQSWQIAFGYGIILLITVGILSTLVSTLIIKGLPEMNAISIMTIAAVLGIPFSYLWGYLGVKFSTKKATMLLYAVIFVMIAFMLIPGTWTAYVTAGLLGCFIGAGNNLTPAIIATVFGRYDFSKALAVIMPIWNIVVAFATTVVGVPQSLTGSYVAAYIVLTVVAVIGFILVVTLDDRCIGREDA